MPPMTAGRLGELTLRCPCGSGLQAAADWETLRQIWETWFPLHAASDEDPTRCQAVAAYDKVTGEQP